MVSHLRDTRVKQGLSLRDLATRTGIDAVRLSRLERMKEKPTPDEVKALCSVLGNPVVHYDDGTGITLDIYLLMLELCQHPSTERGVAFVDGHDKNDQPFGGMVETVCCTVCGETLEIL